MILDEEFMLERMKRLTQRGQIRFLRELRYVHTKKVLCGGTLEERKRYQGLSVPFNS